jgi:DNA-binding NarL/FixJ family response regulator
VRGPRARNIATFGEVPTMMASTASGEPPAILIVEDHRLLAQSLQLGLREEGLAATVSSVHDCETVMKEAGDADIVLLDLDLGPLGSGADLVRPLREAGCEVVVLTGVRRRVDIAEALERGAVGYVTKSESFDDLLAAISDLTSLRRLLSEGQREQLLGELQAVRAERQRRLERFEQLTDSEQLVLARLMDGTSAQEIASERVVSLATVRTQIRSVLRKLGVGSQLAAVALARRCGWGPPRP